MYHYIACGLDNVWLSNGYIEKNTAYGKGVAVVSADELHAALGRDLVNKSGRLTGKELRFLRVQMGLSQSGFAALQGVTEQAVSLWERRGKVPMANDRLTRVYYLAHVAKDTPLGEAVDRLKTVERLVRQKIVACTTARKGWTSRVSEDEALA